MSVLLVGTLLSSVAHAQEVSSAQPSTDVVATALHALAARRPPGDTRSKRPTALGRATATPTANRAARPSERAEDPVGEELLRRGLASLRKGDRRSSAPRPAGRSAGTTATRGATESTSGANAPEPADTAPPLLFSPPSARPTTSALAGESDELAALRRFELDSFGFEQSDEAIPSDADREGDVASARQRDRAPRGADGGPRSGVGILEDLPAAARSDGLRVRPSGTPAATDDPFLRALKLPDFPVRWDPKVVQYLKFYRDDPRGRALMKVCLQRLGRYRPMIDRVLTRHRLPRDLVFLSMVESAFNPRAKSPAGATGLWQLMDQAAKIYGLSHTYWVDERRNPERSTEAAARFLKDLHARFGSWHLAMAAYNAGYGGVLQSIRRLNTNDYWELLRHENGLPWETALYVPKIIATAIVANNREAFGFGDVVEEPTVTYDKVAVPAATSLDAVSRAAGATLSEVTLLNSELHRERVPPAADGGRSNETYEVRIPRGTREQFLSAFAQANSGAVATHLMRFGERLDEVARSYGLSERELRRLNGVEDSTEVRAGVTLIVPSGAGLGGAAVALASATESLPSLVAVPDANFSIAGRERAFYRIKLGDTLEEIAQVFRVSVEDLEAWNSLDASARLQQDQVVQIFVAAGFERQQVALLPSEQVRVVTIGSDEHLDEVELRRGRRRVKYIVKDGDTMARIGRRFGLTPGDIGRINRMGNDDPPVGTELTVYVQTDKPLTATPSSMAARTVRPASRPPTAVEAEPAATRRAESTARTKSSAMYRVKSGDTLTKVAKTLGVSPAELAKANRLNLRGPLPAGSTLRIP